MSENKPLLLEDHEPITKLPLTKDLTRNLPHDQLTTMFPTPPSHELPSIASPVDTLDHDGFSVHVPSHVKHEPRSPMAGYGEDLHDDDLSIMLASSKFAPLQRHPPDMVVPMDCVWKPSSHKPFHDASLGRSGQHAGALLSDDSPGHAERLVQARPLAHIHRQVPRRPQESHRAGLRGTPQRGRSKSVGPPSLASPASHSYQNKSARLLLLSPASIRE